METEALSTRPDISWPGLLDFKIMQKQCQSGHRGQITVGRTWHWLLNQGETSQIRSHSTEFGSDSQCLHTT